MCTMAQAGTPAPRDDERRFARRIDCWVLEATGRGLTTFDDLVVSLPGVYPATVLDALRRLAATGALSPAILSRAVEDAARQPPRRSSVRHRIALPIPHPLDYDWRFSEAAIDRVLDECLGLTGRDDVVALLDAPSIMRAVVERDYPRRALLLDRNVTPNGDLAASVRPTDAVVHCDLGEDPLPDVSTSIVVLDPPWYDEDIRAFLWAAHRLCKVGGHVLLSVPPIGTRPGVTEEQARLMDWARALGFAPVRTAVAALPYASPLFERNALRAEMVSNVPPEWRRGDLAVLVREDARVLPRPSAPPQMDRASAWVEEALQGVRFRIRRSGPASTMDTPLLPCVPGDILPSVSRRDGRRHADVWTSGNRIFRCRDPHAFTSILRGLAGDHDPYTEMRAIVGRQLTQVEVALISYTTRQVRRIITLERAEAGLVGEDE
jgi:SAM-dependent methyltransferase